MKGATATEKYRYGYVFGILATLILLAAGCATQPGTIRYENIDNFTSSRFGLNISNYPATDLDSTIGEISIRVPYADLIFTRSDSSFMAHYQLSMTFYADSELSESVLSRTFDRRISTRKFSQTTSNRLYDAFTESVVVKPGDYLISLRLLDLSTDVTSSREFKHTFKNFSQGEVNISDIVLHNRSDSSGVPVEVSPKPGDSLIADFYLTSKETPKDISLRLLAISTETPASLDTILTLHQLSDIQHYRVPLKTAGLEPAIYDLRLSVGEDFSETSFRMEPESGLQNNTSFDRQIGPLAYIMTRGEFDSVRNAGRELRDKLLNDFWISRSRGDTIVASAMENEFYKRTGYVDDEFGTYSLFGWQTDRGRILIVYGKPDRIENHIENFRSGPAANSLPYQVWYYSALNLRFVFVDELRNGNYELAKAGGP